MRPIPHLAGHFARVITYESGPYAQTLIDDFSKKAKAPHIAISVDMLDTGIDVPEVRQPRLLQAGSLEDEVLADDGARHAALPRSVRAGRGQGILPRLRLLPEPRILRRQPGDERGGRGEIAFGTAVRGKARSRARARRQRRQGGWVRGRRSAPFEAQGARETPAERSGHPRRRAERPCRRSSPA